MVKLVRFGGGRTGVVVGSGADVVLDVEASLAAFAVRDPEAAGVLAEVLPSGDAGWGLLIERWSVARGALRAMVDVVGSGESAGFVVVPLAEVVLEPPLPEAAGRTFAMGGNFPAHVSHAPDDVGRLPSSIFAGKAGGFPPWGYCVLPGTHVTTGAVVRPPRGVRKLDYEAEVAVVLAPSATDRGVRAWGYLAWNDFSIRDHAFGLSHDDHGPLTWSVSKNFDTGNACGPWVVVLDDEDSVDVNDLTLECRVNGEVRQRGSTAEMTFGFDEIAIYLSRFLTLRAGDVVVSGTPSGTAMEGGVDGPFLRDGDEVEVEVTGAGVLRNRVEFR